MRYEYGIESVPFEQPVQRAQAVLATANRLGPEGWRVLSLDVAPRLAINEQPLEVLFERETG